MRNLSLVPTAKPEHAELVQQLAKKLSKLLEEFSEEVFTAAVSVAMKDAGELREPREISFEALMKSDDPTVKALGEMHVQVRRCIETLGGRVSVPRS